MFGDILSNLLIMLIVFAYCLFLTEVLELLFAFIFGVRRKDLGLVALANALTNPWVVFLVSVNADKHFTYTIILPILELTAIAVEAFIYRKYSQTIRYPIWLSIGANLFSLIVGTLIGTFMVMLLIAFSMYKF
ncbi:MAG: hypothetical protein Q4F00_10815 [bacterium]|nr:hypothetical protein [bacterium]